MNFNTLTPFNLINHLILISVILKTLTHTHNVALVCISYNLHWIFFISSSLTISLGFPFLVNFLCFSLWCSHSEWNTCLVSVHNNHQSQLLSSHWALALLVVLYVLTAMPLRSVVEVLCCRCCSWYLEYVYFDWIDIIPKSQTYNVSLM